MPSFGDGKDIFLHDDCNKDKNCTANLGGSYECPNGFKFKDDNTK